MRHELFRRFTRESRGNVAIIFGLCAVPLIFAVGLAIDYGNNMRRWAQVNAAADAAVLAAVTPGMMLQSDSAAEALMKSTFDAQTQDISGVAFTSAPQFNATTLPSGVRNASINYHAEFSNVFGGILGGQWMYRDGATAANGSPQNMNFYLLLDTSPSMEIAGTSDGIQTMLKNTTKQPNGGCAFACHEMNPSGDNAGNPNGEDNYALARSLGVLLRIDMVATAAVGMVQAAISEQSAALASYGTSPIYNIAIYNFDWMLHNNLGGLRSDLSTLQSQLAATPSPIRPLQVYNENDRCNSYQSSPNDSQCVSSAGASSNSDTDTNIDAALTALDTPSSSTYIQSPSTVHAQQVLLIVTDGVEDETVSPITAGSTSLASGTRQIAPIAFNANVPSYKTCADLKSRGVTIGVLYTAYVPLDNGSVGSFYDKNVLPFQPGASLANDQIGPGLANCASNASLFITVPPSNDPNAIATALQKLFLAAQGSHLTQ
jgi:Flp pilus assembly protein TadG